MHANLTLSDDPEDIHEHFSYYWEKADVLITSGGLGPTVDDRTKEIVAECLDEMLIFDSEIMQAIEKRFADIGMEMTDNNRTQAYRFKNGEVLSNPQGTAPGLWLEKDEKTLIMLPGPPRELIPMFEDVVIPKLQESGKLQNTERYLQIRTVGIGESTLETLLQPTIDKTESVEIAFCAHQGMVDFRLSFPSEEDAYDKLIALAGECRQLLGEHFMCIGHAPLVKVVSDILRRRDLSLAVAESCTGGLIAHEFTNIAGSSNFFLGGLTTYSDESKSELLDIPEEMIQQHTAVSAEVALAMVTGVAERLESDYALSTTGYAGPSGGTTEDPVGTVYIGLHSPRGVWVKKHFFRGDRETIKRRAYNAAIDWLRRELVAEQSEEDANNDLRAESEQILRSLK